MKVLYYSTCSCSQPHMGVLLNSLREDVRNGNEVYWVYCNRSQTSCLMNANACGALCLFCSFSYKQLFKDYGKSVRIIPLNTAHKSRTPFEYNNSDELKRISYKGVQIGYSVLSFYISRTRNMDFVINAEMRKYFDYIVREICDVTDSMINIVDEINPDKIVTYNGRLYENRFIYDIAKSKNIKFNSLEVVGGMNEPYYPVHYPEGLPHNISQFTKLADKSWNESKLSDEKKIEKASSFYIKRRNGVVAGDKVYTSLQQKGLLPEGFDESKHNIAIFNSSADEIAAIGEEWDESTRLFKSQYESIKYILDNAPSDYHFYLRIHPNLKDVTYQYHTDLYKLGKDYSNITVIEPKSCISTYSLMDVCEKVVVFGSTMGVEACYWGKPVILIGTAFYAGMDVCYKVKTMSDVTTLMNDRLKPKDKIGALKYAFFLMDRDVRVDHYNNIDINYKRFFLFNLPFTVSKYLKILGSNKLHAVVYTIYSRIVYRVCHCKLSFPK